MNFVVCEVIRHHHARFSPPCIRGFTQYVVEIVRGNGPEIRNLDFIANDVKPITGGHAGFRRTPLHEIHVGFVHLFHLRVFLLLR